MTRGNELQKIREILHRRRRDILQVNAGTHEELRALQDQDRGPELEENAQAELADYTLSHLLETQRRELRLIDAAFERMEQDMFGSCVDCGSEIPFDRLAALPFALRCEEDASRHEQETMGNYAIPSL
jgi:DnaK suppressor protein